MNDNPSNNDVTSDTEDTSHLADSREDAVSLVASESTAPANNVSTNAEPVKKKTNKWLLLIPIVLLLVAAAAAAWYMSSRSAPVATTTPKAPAVRIGLSLDTYRESRWEKDQEYLEDRAEEKGAKLTTLSAEGDPTLQNEQIENLIAQQVDVLMIVPNDAEAIAPVIAKAKAAGIKVLSYDRLILNSDIDVYVSFDNEQVGKNSAKYVVDAVAAKKGAKIAYVGGAPTDNNATLIKKGAMEVLNPHISSGAIKLVYDVPTPEWKPDLAYGSLKNFLAKGNQVDGVIAGNDGTAFGAIRALQESGKTGIPVTGQDAELTAIQRVIAGTQLMTNYKPIRLLANESIDIAIGLAQGKELKQNAKISNGFKDVRSYLLTPVPVTKTNIDETVIKDGFYTKTEVYEQ